MTAPFTFLRKIVIYYLIVTLAAETVEQGTNKETHIANITAKLIILFSLHSFLNKLTILFL